MPELDPEVVERARRWCAEAGRHVGAAEVEAALGPLPWIDLLAVKALLADPPPARPLGPFALVDLARGAPADVAAEREREGRYRRDEDRAAPARPDEAATGPAPEPRRRAPAPSRGPGVVVRRARERVAPGAPSAPALPGLEALRAPEGRAELERLVRRHGARRAAILGALAAGWRRADGGAPGADDLAELLELHGLARAFRRREGDEALHALRAAGGLRARAAAHLGTDAPGLDAALAGVAGEAEAIREERRAELRARATLAERVALLLRDEERLADLGLLDEIERDLRARLPEHVRALGRGGEPVAAGLARSLSVSQGDADALAARFGLAVAAPAASAPAAARPASGGEGAERRPRPERQRRAPQRERRGASAPRPRGPGGPRPARQGGGRAGAPGRRGGPARPGGPAGAASRPPGPRSGAAPRPGGPKAPAGGPGRAGGPARRPGPRRPGPPKRFGGPGRPGGPRGGGKRR